MLEGASENSILQWAITDWFSGDHVLCGNYYEGAVCLTCMLAGFERSRCSRYFIREERYKLFDKGRIWSH